jgi:hypothetical protein
MDMVTDITTVGTVTATMVMGTIITTTASTVMASLRSGSADLHG